MLLHRVGLLPFIEAKLAADMATGISYLHMTDVSIVHGDLKAANVLLTRDWSVRLHAARGMTSK